jgi:hypothetical protein
MTNEKLDTLINLMLENLPEDDKAELLAETGVVVAEPAVALFPPDFNAKFWARIRREDAEIAAAKEAESPREPAKPPVKEQPRVHLRKEP